MVQQGGTLTLRSVFPPDSIPAWASIYTGLNPAAHGLIQSIDYLSSKSHRLKADFSHFQKKTFWDLAGQAGRRVCIVNPFMAYPVWPVNGIMVSGPVFISGEAQAYPASILHEYQVPSLGGIVEFPTRKTLDRFCRQADEATRDLADFALSLWAREEWDLFFVCFLTADRIQHFLWRYHDPEDPTCPGQGAFKDVIREFYRRFDQVVGRFLEAAGDQVSVLVLSDHGHRRRSTKTLNLNEFLRQRGYLASRVGKHRALDHRYWMERLKTGVLQLMYRHDLEDVVSRVARFIPRRKALKDSSFITDREGSLAFTPDFAGRNPFGGVIICRAEVDRRELDYGSFRRQLMAEIADLRDPDTGKRVVSWVRPREELYSGPHLDKYPDIVFELDPEYSVSWDLYGRVVGLNPTHKKISGGHRTDGVLMTANTSRRAVQRKPCLMDIAPTVLDLLHVPLPNRFDGASLFR